jgi:hypothetical protein
MSSPAVPYTPATDRPAPSLFERPFRWFQRARDRRRARMLAEAYTEARIALGQRMFAAGIDDDETGATIASIGEALARNLASGAEAQDLRAERVLLFIRLADAALEDDAPLPGADVEFAEALELKRALEADRVAEFIRA